jgi:hypothetical protein
MSEDAGILGASAVRPSGTRTDEAGREATGQRRNSPLVGTGISSPLAIFCLGRWDTASRVAAAA